MLLCLMLAAAAAGCGKNNGTGGTLANNQKSVNDVLQEGMAKADEKAQSSSDSGGKSETLIRDGLNTDTPENKDEKGKNPPSGTADEVDIDLTSMSATMVYSEVYNMMYRSDNYIGKTVKMDGVFKVYNDKSTGNCYFACIIQDATACCTQGLEFIPTDDYSYPDDYPEDGEQITVVGVFNTFMDGEYPYCALSNATIV